MLDSSPAAATTEPQQPPHTARRHGPGRPFEKGRSGNAAGRSTKPPDLGELCRRYARRAVRALVRELNGSDPQAATRAAEILLSHAFGKPVQHHALYVPKIAVECHAAEPASDGAYGEDAKPSRAWDA
jgi:hypothetical protein